MRPFLFALGLLALPACQSAPFVKAETAAANVLLPPSDEKKLGDQVRSEVEQKAKLLNDPEVTNYVSGVGQRVAAASPNPDQWVFTFKVIDDPNTVNAFAIPGGTIYVYSGLLKAARDEAQLGGVLAHEVAHVTSRHVARRMVNAYGLEALSGLALGQNPGLAEKIAANIVVGGALLKNSRNDEAEADSKGVVAASQAGYAPMGLVEFFQTLQKSEGKTPAALTFLSDHPTTSDRITAVENEIREKNLTGAQRNAPAFEAIQQKIR